MESNEVHISSMVVHTAPAALAGVIRDIECLPGTEIHGQSECGKLVVVVESCGQGGITDIIDQINGLPQVLSTALVYHQVEPLAACGSDPT